MGDSADLSDRSIHFLWGVILSTSYVFVNSAMSCIFRPTISMPVSAGYFLFYVGQLLSALPTIPLALKRWELDSGAKFFSFAALGTLSAVNFALWRSAVAVMPLGDYATFDCAGLLVAPLIIALQRRRRPGVVDLLGAAMAAAGIVLITRPEFIFGGKTTTPIHAYVYALFGGFVTMASPYLFGFFPRVHWSNFQCVNLVSGFVVLGVILAIFGAPRFSASPMAASPMIVFGIVTTGVMSNVYRLAQQLGCAELESTGAGNAGFINNVFNAGMIPTTALMSLEYFDETLSEEETVGVVVVFVAIVVVTFFKWWNKEEVED